MVKIKITEDQDNCVTVYWAELTGLLPEGDPRLRGCGRSPEEAMRSLMRDAKSWIEGLVCDAIDYYYATDAQEEARKMLTKTKGEQ